MENFVAAPIVNAHTPIQGFGNPPMNSPNQYQYHNQPNQNYPFFAPNYPPCYGYQQAPMYGPPMAQPCYSYNTGGNTNGSGTQRSGDLMVGNQTTKNKPNGVKIGSIGGNHGNSGGQQVAGDINVGDIGC